jgi:branched-chain amino acid transport system substrate-binding protein
LRLAILLTAVWLSLSPTVTAETIDDSREAVSLYEQGKRQLREGQWLQAARTFEELSGRFTDSPNIDLFLFNRAKAEYYFGDFAKSRASFSNFISSFPRSGLVAHAEYFLGNIEYVHADLSTAFEHFVRAFARSDDPRLSDMIVQSLTEAIGHAESVSLSPLDFAPIPHGKKCDLMVPLAHALRAAGQAGTADRLLAECGTADGGGSGGPVSGASLEIAVVLPFSGELEPFGRDVYNGALMAAEKYREETGRPLQLRAFDTKGDPVDAARIVRQLSGGGTHVIVGPLTSDEAAVASAALACGETPLIAPAATQTGLTRLSETSFQLSPNIELQGVSMAEYAVNELGADSAAIITSTVADHLRMARAFARRFQELGGTVAALEYYRPRDKDFGPYIRDVKGILLGEQPDSAHFIDERGDTLDFDIVPAAVDCLFLPGSPEQLRLLVPQVHFYNLSGALLGSDGWGDDKIYRLGDQITKRAVFPSPFISGPQSEAAVRFAADYDTRFGERPGRLARLGFDAVQLVTSIVNESGIETVGLVDALARISGFEGASGTVTFGTSRENVALPLYRIEGGRPIFLGIGGTIDNAADDL